MPRKNYETKSIQPKNERRSYRVLTDAGFQALIRDICEIEAPKDAEVYFTMDNYSARVTVERSFLVECTLYINSQIDWRGIKFGKDADGEWWRIDEINFKIEANWSATSRSLPAAAAAAQLYLEMINLGNNISAAIRDYDLLFLRKVTEEQMAEIEKANAK